MSSKHGYFSTIMFVVGLTAIFVKCTYCGLNYITTFYDPFQDFGFELHLQGEQKFHAMGYQQLFVFGCLGCGIELREKR